MAFEVPDLFRIYTMIAGNTVNLKNTATTVNKATSDFHSHKKRYGSKQQRNEDTRSYYSLTLKQFLKSYASKHYMARKSLKALCFAGLFGHEWILILIGSVLLLICSILHKPCI